MDIQRPADPLRKRPAPKPAKKSKKGREIDDVDFLKPAPPPAPRLPKRGGIAALREWIKKNPTQPSENPNVEYTNNPIEFDLFRPKDRGYTPPGKSF